MIKYKERRKKQIQVFEGEDVYQERPMAKSEGEK